MWPSLFPVCKNAAGSRQSPININSTAAKYDNTLGKLVLSKYDTTNSNKMKLSNNGHSVTVSMGNNKFESMVTHKGTGTYNMSQRQITTLPLTFLYPSVGKQKGFSDQSSRLGFGFCIRSTQLQNRGKSEIGNHGNFFAAEIVSMTLSSHNLILHIFLYSYIIIDIRKRGQISRLPII